jgi:hypothetical protein
MSGACAQRAGSNGVLIMPASIAEKCVASNLAILMFASGQWSGILMDIVFDSGQIRYRRQRCWRTTTEVSTFVCTMQTSLCTCCTWSCSRTPCLLCLSCVRKVIFYRDIGIKLMSHIPCRHRKPESPWRNDAHVVFPNHSDALRPAKHLMGSLMSHGFRHCSTYQTLSTIRRDDQSDMPHA